MNGLLDYWLVGEFFSTQSLSSLMRDRDSGEKKLGLSLFSHVLTRDPCKEAKNLRRDFMLGLDLKFRKLCKKETNKGNLARNI